MFVSDTFYLVIFHFFFYVRYSRKHVSVFQIMFSKDFAAFFIKSKKRPNYRLPSTTYLLVASLNFTVDK